MAKSRMTAAKKAVMAYVREPHSDVRVAATWPITRDDPTICLRLLIGGVRMTWLWAGEEGYGAATYAADSETARRDLARLLGDWLAGGEGKTADSSSADW